MTEWLAVVTITILAVISPGPDFAMVSRNALSHSRKAGLMTALGIGTGVLVHVVYTLLGIGLLVHYSPILLHVLKLTGAAYLIWLGARMLAAHGTDPDIDGTPMALRGVTAFRIGFLTNALNPKTSIFIVSLFVQSVEPGTSMTIRLVYGAFISLIHMAWFAIVGLIFGSAPLRRSLLAWRVWIDRAFGAALVGFGLALIFVN